MFYLNCITYTVYVIQHYSYTFNLDLRVEKITVYKGLIVDGIKLESFGVGACKKTRLFGGDGAGPSGTTEFTLQAGETIKSIRFARKLADDWTGWWSSGFLCNIAVGRFQKLLSKV